MIMWSRNKSASWFNQKTDAERQILIEKAMTLKMKVEYKARKEVLKNRKIEVVKDLQEAKRLLEEKRMNRRLESVNYILRNNVRAWFSSLTEVGFDF